MATAPSHLTSAVIKSGLSKLLFAAKPVLRPLARATLGKLPAPASRLTGALARDGGTPVRDIRLRPYASTNDGNLLRWHVEARALFRRIYLSGAEGLPQAIAERFADEWATYCGCRYGLLLMHGTDALRLGLAAALDHDGLDYGGEVIVPNFSFIASATAPLDRRFGLALVDVDPATLLLDPRRVEEAIIPGRTRAILPVHLFGQPADMSSLRAVADRHGLKIVEDAAQAHGAALAGGSVGSLGDVGAFSFQSSKNLACGEGGALVTNDEQIYERAYAMHNAGRPRSPDNRWQHVTLGWNCRPTEYQAALLHHRLRFFDQQQRLRFDNFEYLRDSMRDVGSLEPLAVHAEVRAHGMYMFAMRYRPERCGGLSIDEFIRCVQAEGAPIGRAFDKTVVQQPGIQALIQKRPSYFRCLPTPVADAAAQNTVYMPQSVFLGSKRDMDDVILAVKKVEAHFSYHANAGRSEVK
jgi:dTDP-4-amino-4,6-dideoxygalactose transaminase